MNKNKELKNYCVDISDCGGQGIVVDNKIDANLQVKTIFPSYSGYRSHDGKGSAEVVIGEFLNQRTRHHIHSSILNGKEIIIKRSMRRKINPELYKIPEALPYIKEREELERKSEEMGIRVGKLIIPNNKDWEMRFQNDPHYYYYDDKIPEHNELFEKRKKQGANLIKECNYETKREMKILEFWGNYFIKTGAIRNYSLFRQKEINEFKKSSLFNKIVSKVEKELKIKLNKHEKDALGMLYLELPQARKIVDEKQVLIKEKGYRNDQWEQLEEDNIKI